MTLLQTIASTRAFHGSAPKKWNRLSSLLKFTSFLQKVIQNLLFLLRFPWHWNLSTSSPGGLLFAPQIHISMLPCASYGGFRWVRGRCKADDWMGYGRNNCWRCQPLIFNEKSVWSLVSLGLRGVWWKDVWWVISLVWELIKSRVKADNYNQLTLYNFFRETCRRSSKKKGPSEVGPNPNFPM